MKQVSRNKFRTTGKRPTNFCFSHSELNLTFPLFNSHWSEQASNKDSFIKYTLPSEILVENDTNFIEFRFRFIPHQLEQRRSLLMFCPLNGGRHQDHRGGGWDDDYVSLLYDDRYVVFKAKHGHGKF